jgi:hypothetical protein
MPGWTFGGDLEVGVSIPFRLKGKKQAAGEVRVSFRNGHFSDPEENLLGEGLVGVIRLGGTVASTDELPIHGEIVLTKGEALLDRYYLDIGPSPLKIRIKGTWKARERSLTDIQGTLEWGERIRASMEGSMSGLWDQMDGMIHADVFFPSHDEIFRTLVVQPAAELQPEWEEANMGGSSHFVARVAAERGQISIKGRWHLKETDLRLPLHDIYVQGLEGEVPFDLPIAGEAEESSVWRGSAEKGQVEIKEARFKALRWSGLLIKVRSAHNRFELIEPLILPLFRGRVMAHNMQISRVMPLPSSIAMSVNIEGVDMGDLTGALTPFEMPGLLEGEFPEILIQGEDLSTKGRVSMKVWEGEVSLENFWGERMFSKRRRWGCEVFMRDLNMELVTQSLEFGRMGGILEGEVDDLAFSFGQPESFELEIRSAKRRGVKQYIDAKAVENLSILSTGVQAPLLPWFKFYPYAKLGIHCKLENDIFTLRGTIVEGETEYLVKRSFLRGINVINRNPNSQIPWKDMVQRVRRIIPQEGKDIHVEMGS